MTPAEPRPCRVESFSLESEALRGNPLGDSARRDVFVVLPPSYDDAPDRRYPVAVLLSGFTGRGRMHLNDNLWNDPIDRRLARLVAAGACREMILALPDAATRLGGSQFLDSTATGRYETHVVSEVVAEVDRRFRTRPGRGNRAVLGKSSGGYGALVLGMRHPDVFGIVVSHSGDASFEHCYLPDFAPTAARLWKSGGVEGFLHAFEKAPKKRGEDILALNILAMASCYSPNPETSPLGFDLPFRLDTGDLREDVWARWLEHDPVRMAARHADALRSLRLLFVDCGTRDQFRLYVGARAFAERCREIGAAVVHEEFDDDHDSIQYRYDVSLPRIGAAFES